MNIVLLPKAAVGQTEWIIQDYNTVEHIQKVLKRQVGDTLKVGFLSGNIGVATVAEVALSSVRISAIQCEQPPPQKLDLTVVLALPRPKVLRRLIMDMTTIGVKHIILVNSYRTDKSYWQSPMLRRIDEFVLHGLQQGVDTIAPTISLKKRFKPFVEDELPELMHNQSAVVAHPYAINAQDTTSLSDYKALYNKLPNIVCIGAEGGWIDYEVDLLCQQGCQMIRLGQRILRTEAAVNVLCGQYL